MKSLLLVIAAVALPIGAASAATAKQSEKKALELVKADLKDPDSARFKDIKPMGDKGGYCGWVNSKNSYGGYTGFSVFYVSSAGKVAILPPEYSEPDLC